MTEEANAEPTNDIPVTTKIRDSYPLIVDKLNNYQAQIDEIELTPGDSAYTVAVNNGFSGTEAEWLASLEGDPGPKGDAGEGVPKGGAAGQVLAKNTATDYDTSWKDDAGLTQSQADKLAALGRTAVLMLSSDYNLANQTWTPVPWDVERADDGNWHSNTTNPDRVTLPAGTYSVIVQMRYNSSSTGDRRQRLLRYASDGTSVIEGVYINGVAVDSYGAVALPFIVRANAGDYLVLETLQSSGGTLAIRSANASLSVTRIG